MVHLVAAGTRSVMCLSCSCRLSLDVRIAAFAFAMLSCLQGCLNFQCTDEMAVNIFTSLMIRRAELTVPSKICPEYFTGIPFLVGCWLCQTVEVGMPLQFHRSSAFHHSLTVHTVFTSHF